MSRESKNAQGVINKRQTNLNLLPTGPTTRRQAQRLASVNSTTVSQIRRDLEHLTIQGESQIVNRTMVTVSSGQPIIQKSPTDTGMETIDEIPDSQPEVESVVEPPTPPASPPASSTFLSVVGGTQEERSLSQVPSAIGRRHIASHPKSSDTPKEPSVNEDAAARPFNLVRVSEGALTREQEHDLNFHVRIAYSQDPASIVLGTRSRKITDREASIGEYRADLYMMVVEGGVPALGHLGAARARWKKSREEAYEALLDSLAEHVEEDFFDY